MDYIFIFKFNNEIMEDDVERCHDRYVRCRVGLQVFRETGMENQYVIVVNRSFSMDVLMGEHSARGVLSMMPEMCGVFYNILI